MLKLIRIFSGKQEPVVGAEGKEESKRRATQRSGLVEWLRSFVRYLAGNWQLGLLALPGLLHVVLFRYAPMGGLVMAFQDFNPIKLFASEWVGFRNFRFLFANPRTGLLITNTLVLSLLFLIAIRISSILLALLLNEIRLKVFKRVTQGIIFLPYFVSWPIVAAMLWGLIDTDLGTINEYIGLVGLEPIDFAARPELWRGLLTTLRVWKSTGSGSVMYLAALASIDPALYEAAAVDGANRLQRMRHISIPALMPLIIITTIIAVGGLFSSDVGMLYAVVGTAYKALYPAIDTIDFYILRSLTTSIEYGYLSAVSILQSVVGFILVVGVNRLARAYSRRQQEEYALF